MGVIQDTEKIPARRKRKSCRGSSKKPGQEKECIRRDRKQTSPSGKETAGIGEKKKKKRDLGALTCNSSSVEVKLVEKCKEEGPFALGPARGKRKKRMQEICAGRGEDYYSGRKGVRCRKWKSSLVKKRIEFP